MHFSCLWRICFVQSFLNYYLCNFLYCRAMLNACHMLTCCSDLYMCNTQDLRFAWPFSCLQSAFTEILHYLLYIFYTSIWMLVWLRWFFFFLYILWKVPIIITNEIDKMCLQYLCYRQECQSIQLYIEFFDKWKISTHLSVSPAASTVRWTPRHGRVGKKITNNLLSCRPRNDGPYDVPMIPSTLHRAPSTGARPVTQPDNT